MKLIVTYTNDSLDLDFGKWLIKRIQEKFILAIDENKLKRWDKFFEESDEYKSIYRKKILTKDILIVGIRNLICRKFPQKLIIHINNNLFVPGLDRVRIETVCKLINFGNTEIKGYPIFTEVFGEVADNIHDYINEYLKGIT